MRKKILIAVMAMICLLTVVLAGCSNITIADVDKDFIGVLQDAVKNSEAYTTYYIREKENTDPNNIAKNEMTEYMLNVQADDKSIAGVDNTKVNFSIKHTKGITEYTDSFIIGQSLSKSVKAKQAQASDYQLYVFKNYKIKRTSPVFTKKCDPIEKDEIFNYETPTDLEISNWTMENVLAPLKALTKDDVKISEKGNLKKGKVTTYTFTVTNEQNKYYGKGELALQLYTDKKVTRVMSLSSVDGKYVLDVMYQGPKIDIANYDNYEMSDNQITLATTRSDGLVELYTMAKEADNFEMQFATTINVEDEFNKDGDSITQAKPDELVYVYKFTTVESAVNWDYEYTEIVVKLVAYDKDGNEVEIDNNLGDTTFFVKTSNIVKTKKDMTSLIPMAAAIVAVIALLLALMALFKIKKQNKELTNQIKVLSGEVDEEQATDAATEEAEAVEAEAKEEVAEEQTAVVEEKTETTDSKKEDDSVVANDDDKE